MDFLNANRLLTFNMFFSVNSKWNAHYFVCFAFLNPRLNHQPRLCLMNHHFKFLISLTGSPKTILVIQNCFNSIHPLSFSIQIIGYDVNHFNRSYLIIFQLWYLPSENTYNLSHFKNNFQLICLFLLDYCFCQLQYFTLRNDIDWSNISALIMNFCNENFYGPQFESTPVNPLQSHLPEWSLSRKDYL